MDKNIIFYSNYDAYSKKILKSIDDYKLTDLFLMICVDTKKYKLPPYVDCVPYIITKQEDRIFDEHVEDFIQSLIKVEICPLEGCQDSKFSYIELPQQNSEVPKQFGVLDQVFHETRILTPPENTNQGPKLDMSKMDSFISARNQDIDLIQKSMPRYN